MIFNVRQFHDFVFILLHENRTLKRALKIRGVIDYFNDEIEFSLVVCMLDITFNIKNSDMLNLNRQKIKLKSYHSAKTGNFNPRLQINSELLYY